MSGHQTQEFSVSYTEFLKELQKERRHLLNGGTSYRMATAELSLSLVNQVKDIVPLLERTSAKETVSKFCPDLDLDRTDDVAKFLYFIATEVHRGTAYYPADVTEYVHQKRQNRKPLSLVIR